MKFTKESLYKFLLSSLIVSQIFGLYGGALVPSRILAMAFLPFCFLNRFSVRMYKQQSFFIVFLLVSFIYSFLLHLLNQTSVNLNNTIYFLINLLLLIEGVYFSSLIDKPYLTIWRAWLIFISLTIPIALIEIFLDIHLSVSYLSSDQVVGLIGLKKQFASVTFGNYNLYNFILVASMPIIASIFLSEEKISNLMRIYILAILSLMLFVIIVNASRGAIASYALSAFIFLWYFIKRNSFKPLFFLKLSVVILPVLGGIIYYILNADFITYLMYRLSSAGFEDNVREGLFENGLNMLFDSYLLGVGPGNFEVRLAQLGKSARILPPHNMFIELLSEYGIFIFIIFITFLLKIYTRTFKSSGEIKFILLASILTLPINFLINSNYIYVVYMWIYFGTLFSISRANLSS